MDHDKDAFIMSKGHGAIAQYVVLEEMGIMTKEEVDSICQPGSRFGSHPDRGNPGVIASTGSLGHGLPIALGIARAENEKQTDATVYLTLSDGEFMEGSVWESLLLAPTLGLSNIVITIDHNKSISRGKIPTSHPNMLPLARKIESFGWETVEANGHSVSEMSTAIQGRQLDRPLALVCHTTKGCGVSFMENAPIWSYRSPSPEEFLLALAEVEYRPHGPLGEMQ
jgi:transketolase